MMECRNCSRGLRVAVDEWLHEGRRSAVLDWKSVRQVRPEGDTHPNRSIAANGGGQLEREYQKKELLRASAQLDSATETSRLQDAGESG